MWFIIFNIWSSFTLATEAMPLPETLWSQSIEQFAQKKFSESIVGLRELLDKFPSDAHALDAQFYLGQSYFRTDKFKEAIPPLRTFVETAVIKPERKEARLLLVRTYLGAEKFSEAGLAIQDYAKSLSAEDPSDRARILLYASQAQIGLKQNLEAEKNLAAFFAMTHELPDLGEELTQGSLVRIRLKSNECERFPSSPDLAEDQVLDQLKRKSLCTIEIASHLSVMGKNPDAKLLDIGFSILQENLSTLKEKSLDPPLGKGKHTTKEWLKAKNELSLKLIPEWNSTVDLTLEILKIREGFQSRIDALKDALKKLGIAEVKAPKAINTEAQKK